MDPLAKKLQYKENFRCLVLGNPAELHWGFPYDESRKENSYDLEVMFITTMEEYKQSFSSFIGGGDDRVRWLVYPKKSGKIPSDLNRDIIWQEMSPAGFQPVSMISLNADWSAMRIRNNKFVRNIPKEKVRMPAELASLLNSNPECQDYFRSLSNTNQKEYMQWISSAKKEETRMKRLEKARSLLRDKVPNPFATR